jgi:uncharacterized protein YrrD
MSLRHSCGPNGIVSPPHHSTGAVKRIQPESVLTGESLRKYRVMSVGGTLIGTLGDVLLDTSTPNGPRVAAFELSGGLREQLSHKYPTFAASQVVSYGHDVLVIPDEVAQSLH